MTDPVIVGSYWTLAGDTNPGSSNPGPEWSPWDFQARVTTASEVGFAGMGFWHADLAHLRSEYTFEEMAHILAEADISYLELEFVEYGHVINGDPEYTERADMLLEAAEVLDADHIKFGNLADVAMDIDDIRHATETFARRAAAVDTQLGLEFVTGDDNITTLEEAVAVVDGIENVGIVIDPWHLVKRGIPFEAVASIPLEDLLYVELNDGFHDLDVDRGTETTNYRALPGEGEFNVGAFVRELEGMGYDGPWGVEVLSRKLREEPMEPLYRRVYERTRGIVTEA